MAKIDTAKIENFESMSVEDKLNALLAYDIEEKAPDNSEITKLKTALSKSNAESAEWKRKLREKQTEQERIEAERAEENKRRDEELAELRREREISKLTAQYLATGYSAELANETAQAFADGDTAKVLANQMAFLEQKKKDLEVAALGKQPGLSVGNPPKGLTKDDEIVAQAMKYAGLT